MYTETELRKHFAALVAGTVCGLLYLFMPAEEFNEEDFYDDDDDDFSDDFNDKDFDGDEYIDVVVASIPEEIKTEFKSSPAW